MIILASPTKQMEFEKPLPDFINDISAELPRFAEEAISINSILADYDEAGIRKLMSVSKILAEKTVRNISRFTAGDTLRPAVFAYSGTVFGALDPCSLSESELEWGQKHLRVLSGLYGYLKPLNPVAPYRLEMKCPLPMPEGESLTGFWKNRVSRALPSEGPVLNLASAEYSKVLNRKNLGSRVIDISFKEQNPEGSLRTVGMYAKVARGLMLRRILQEQPTDPESLKTESVGGYEFDVSHSKSGDWVFVRKA